MQLRFKQKVEIEQIRAIEEQLGEQTVSISSTSPTNNFTDALLIRYQLIKQKPDMAAALEHPQQLYRWCTGFVLIVMALAGAATTVKAVTGSGESINIFWILIVLLGFNLVSLALWLFASLLLRQKSSGIFASLVKSIMEKLSFRGKLHPGAISQQTWLLQHFKSPMGRWQFGRITHSVWLAYLAGGFLSLLIVFATRQFDFYWGSTLLSGQTFVSLSQVLAKPLHLLAIPVPSAEQILQSQAQTLSTQLGDSRRSWAYFLLGCVMLYGVLPRILAWSVCWVFHYRAKNNYQLHFSDPYYIRLRHALCPTSTDTKIIDQDSSIGGETSTLPKLGKLTDLPANTNFIGLEINNNDWPVAGIPTHQLIGNIIDSTSLNQTASKINDTDHTLAVIVDTNKAADRGHKRTIKQLLLHTDAAHCWLVLFQSSNSLPTNKVQAWIELARQLNINDNHIVSFHQ